MPSVCFGARPMFGISAPFWPAPDCATAAPNEATTMRETMNSLRMTKSP